MTKKSDSGKHPGSENGTKPKDIAGDSGKKIKEGGFVVVDVTIKDESLPDAFPQGEVDGFVAVACGLKKAWEAKDEDETKKENKPNWKMIYFSSH